MRFRRGGFGDLAELREPSVAAGALLLLGGQHQINRQQPQEALRILVSALVGELQALLGIFFKQTHGD